MGAGRVGKCNQDASGQSEDNAYDSSAGQMSLHKNCEAQGDPDDFRTNDGRGACNGGVGEGFKPECKMQGQENTADRTETDGKLRSLTKGHKNI